MKIAVTGATGLVGRAVVEAALAGDDTVVRLLRRPTATAPARCKDVVTGDLTVSSGEQPMIPKCDVFIHCAALVPSVRRIDRASQTALYQLTNFQGTQAALALCAASSARRFVLVSSLKVNGEATRRGRPFVAIDPPCPEDEYARSKLEAERIAESIAANLGIELVVVRPPLVYGPGAGGNFARLAHLAASGLPLPFAAVANRRSLISDRNLADLLLAASRCPSPPSSVILASDGEALSTPMLLQRLASAQGRSARLWSCPQSLLELFKKLPFAGELLRRLLDDLEVDLAGNPPELGWRPAFDASDEIERSLGG